MNEILEALLLNKIGGGGGYPEPTGTKQITANGTGIDVKNYATADVDVPNSYVQADEGKVVQSGALVAQTQKSINANGTVDTTANNSVVVNVPTGGLKEYTSGAIPKNTFKTWANTFNSGSTLTVALAPTDETVVEVGDEVLVHGKITSTAGTNFKYYVTGEVTSFDSSNKPVITVKGLGQPSPIADGSMITNSNGNFDVKEYAAITVNVQGSGTTYITQNGTHDVGGYRWASVDVQSPEENLLIAADATFQSTPIEEGTCSATLDDSSVLTGHTTGDPIVLYGLDGLSGTDYYLVYGRITYIDSGVEFNVTKVISIGGGKKAAFPILTGGAFRSYPDTGMTTYYDAKTAGDLDGIAQGDTIIASGSNDGSDYVVIGTVNDLDGSLGVQINIMDSAMNFSGILYSFDSGSFIDEPTGGRDVTFYPDDPSQLSGISYDDGVICVGTYNDTLYAMFGRSHTTQSDSIEVFSSWAHSV